MRLKHHVGLDSLQALVKQGLLTGAFTYNLEFGDRCVLDKNTKVKFGTVIHRSGGFLDCTHVDAWGPTKIASLKGYQ